MSKGHRLFFQSLLFLACNLALLPIPAQDEGEATRSLVTVHSRRQALAEFTLERERLRETGNFFELVQTINRIGELHLKLCELDAALADAEDSLGLARKFAGTEHERLLVDTLVFSARVHVKRHDNHTATNILDEAQQLSRNLKYRHGEAQCLTQLGVAYLQLSKLPNAEETNRQALQIWRELQDKRGEAVTLTNQGETYILLDQPDQAADALRSAENLWRTLNDSAELAATLVDLNFLAIRQGQWQQALSLLSEAQTLVTEKEAEPYIAGQIAMSFGEAYEAYGQLETALSYFVEALGHYRGGANDKSAAIDAGNKAARVQARLGDYGEAIKQIGQGLQLAQQIDNELLVGLCHEDLGRIWLAAESNEQARQEFLLAITHYEKSGNRSHRPWARAQTYLGQTEHLLGNLVPAAQSYRKALRVFQNIHDYSNEAALSFGLGKLALQQEQFEEAGSYLERSILLTEQLRENAASKDLRASFLASVHDRYETYVEWLMARHASQPKKGFDVLALEASESSRARSLLDSVKDYQRELRQSSNPALLIDEEKLQKEEQKLLDRKAMLWSQGGAGESKALLETELTQVRARYEALQAKINTSSRFTNLLRPAALKFAEIQSQVTDAETVLLEYSLGDQGSYLWVVSADRLDTYKLADKQTIETAARQVAQLLSQPQDDPIQVTALREATVELSGLILGPLSQLRTRRLIIVPDGILQYIPFQVLTLSPQTNEPLVANYEIVNAPSASTLAIARQTASARRSGSKLIAAFGAPVFPSSHLASAGSTARGLPVAAAPGPSEQSKVEESDDTFHPNQVRPLVFAKMELNQLQRLGQQGGSIIYSDFDATRDNLRKLDLSEYRILHFATHGFLNSKQPELSGLVLSLVDSGGQRVDGFVGLSDIYNLHAPVDLVVLSACRTALGKDVRGEGLIGLTRGFMYAGASSVVASLWKVDDEATAELMRHFYTNLLQLGMPPAAALREAQNSIRKQPHWQSPYFWAAFTLQGNYQQVIKPTHQPSWVPRTIIYSVGSLVGLIAIALWWYFRRRLAHPGRVA